MAENCQKWASRRGESTVILWFHDLFPQPRLRKGSTDDAVPKRPYETDLESFFVFSLDSILGWRIFGERYSCVHRSQEDGRGVHTDVNEITTPTQIALSKLLGALLRRGCRLTVTVQDRPSLLLIVVNAPDERL